MWRSNNHLMVYYKKQNMIMVSSGQANAYRISHTPD